MSVEVIIKMGGGGGMARDQPTASTRMKSSTLENVEGCRGIPVSIHTLYVESSADLGLKWREMVPALSLMSPW